ncbi:hypothetical protein L2E82_17151 [Cichorium intybus]|uniref:Uncharacterized protein n=1 Tax=Cichorium intybus TaxID=13427 RepID=A0ACB9F743_CICIN|nr:hypothetical protein L2E82_17151 [Cichorium intybus]
MQHPPSLFFDLRLICGLRVFLPNSAIPHYVDELVSPKEITSPKNSKLPLNAYMLHNLAHVELNAIDLAWDTVVRFSPYHDLLGDMFFSDFAHVADDESRHLAWCSQRLFELGLSPGDVINRTPCTTFRDLLKEYNVEVKGPFNYTARQEAGLPRNWFVTGCSKNQHSMLMGFLDSAAMSLFGLVEVTGFLLFILSSNPLM